MTRLLTEGFEGASAVITSTTRHSGAVAALNGGVGLSPSSGFVGVLGRTYYLRGYIYVTAFPTSPNVEYFIRAFAGQAYQVLVSHDGRFVLRYGATPIGQTVAGFITLNQWYRVELAVRTGTGAVDYAEAKIDGVTIASETNVARDEAAINSLDATARPNASGGAWLADDIAFNDDQGVSQNSWPGDAKIVNLNPVADSARGANWTAGAGGTSNLFDAVNNIPPTAVATASATNTSQIKNAAKDVAGTYDAQLQSYDEAGIPASDAIVAVQPIMWFGSGSTTARSMGLAGVSNPVVAEKLANTSSPAVGAWSTGWWPNYGNIVQLPSVTRSVRPVVRVRKNANVTDVLQVAYIGLIVEYATPDAPSAINKLVSVA